MAIVVEDGTGVSGANAYADLAYIRDYASARGTTLSADDATLEPLVHRAMDYLEGLGLGLLSLTWPSDDGKVCGLTDAQALTRLKNGLAQLAIEQHGGVNLAPSRTEAFITEETVGPLTTKYSDKHGGGPGSAPDMPAVDALLGPLRTCGQPSTFTTVRV